MVKASGNPSNISTPNRRNVMEFNRQEIQMLADNLIFSGTSKNANELTRKIDSILDIYDSRCQVIKESGSSSDVVIRLSVITEINEDPCDMENPPMCDG
jgi:hypothetical protein